MAQDVCQYCFQVFSGRWQHRVSNTCSNHEEVCSNNPNRNTPGPDLKEALDKAREELGDW